MLFDPHHGNHHHPQHHHHHPPHPPLPPHPIEERHRAAHPLPGIEPRRSSGNPRTDRGPRWASWNLGIFICIRCAGIHRNLGVHISRVKSVNLDQWTQEQVQCVQEMGNAKAKRLYEAFLPECFQRPESDQSAENFIRDKYDKKKYMDKVIDIQMLRKEKSCENIPKEPVVFEKMKIKKDVSPKMDSQCVTDLLGLDAPAPSPAASNGVPASTESPPGSNLLHPALDLLSHISDPSASFTKNTAASTFLPQSRVTASVPENLSLFLDPAPRKGEGTFRKLSKDSILSLYGSTPSVHMSGLAPPHGLYMNQMGYPTHPYGSYHSLAHAGGMAGAMVVSQAAVMGQHRNGFMAAQGALAHRGAGVPPGMIQQGGVVMQQQGAGMMAHRGAGGFPLLPQQQALATQQLQWNFGQMTQHTSGTNLFSVNSQPTGSNAAPTSAHMTAHVWK
ncbi:stromal membrane-associated protein 2 isoform X2 [Syngnathoides biaculeatus]|uniref:stromal membrane-associated protein 2 isoform X2 n=1 Tax=Syngnathoides biaculeatus TaxID=300417 RepID=UPI002ADDD33D|nr:stromal membrane-associated protein 2 isoform X2 [Syngnathoides biaculeatus]XP_061673659.1 stromal membrane-associated protein 2 isoform X2 [Syngnathoides biaculeatus]